MSVELAVKGLAILTAIPLVLLALWADYFGRSLDRRMSEDDELDRPTEMYKIRLAGITAIFFQLGIFLGTGPIREHVPLIANLMFATSIVFQAAIQGRLEKKLRETGKSPRKEFEVAVNAFFWATLAGFLYIGALLLPVAAASFITQSLHSSGSTAATWIAIAAVVGMATGLGLNFAMGAFYLRKTLPCRAIEDERDLALLDGCFASAGLRAPSLWIVETGRVREGIAMLAGFQGGRGPFRPGLFISRGMIEVLTRPELRAVVLHEVGHLKLHHLRNRLLYSTVLILGTTAAAIACVLLANLAVPEGELRLWTGYAAAAVAFMQTFRLLRRQSRAQELEADFYCVERLGAGLDDFSSALRKLDALNPRGPRAAENPIAVLNGMGHPATELRIAILRARAGIKAAEAAPAEIQHDRAA